MGDAEPDRMRFVVGLGNPGRRYAPTRHNVGFRVVAEVHRRWGFGPERDAFDGLAADGRCRRGDAARRVMLFRPMTYMNDSGSAVRKMVDYYKSGREDLLVVLDDMALPLGRLRARAGGSAGGHKGLADVLRALGSPDVARLRLGIGAPPGRMDPTDFVLGCFTEAEADAVGPAVQMAADAVEDWVFGGTTFVMERYNRRPEADPDD